jgi:uncharacterized protein (DUF58 family)
METRDLLRKVRRIQIRTSHVVNDALAGQYHSAFRGRGMEFEEVRPYQIGDDVRTIDWNVSARHGEPFVKIFREERELTVMLLVDLSRSQQFGTKESFKRELVAEIAATLAFSAITNNDKVGLILFTSAVERFVPPRKGTTHVLRVVREVLAFEPKGVGTDIAIAIDHLRRIAHRKYVVFLISDFQVAGYSKALKLARRRHDVIAIDVSDQREMELPRVGMVELFDNETGERIMVDTSSRATRRAFAQHAEAMREQRLKFFRSARIDSIRLTTGESIVGPLTQFFRMREARR